MKNTLLMMSKIQSGVGTLSNLNRLIPLFILILLLLGIVLVLSRNQKLRHEKKIGIILVILLLVVSITFFQRNNQKKDLINISKLSEEFMDNYFTEYSSSKTEQEKENMLIVTSLNGIDNDYGAVKVIEAPNNQYILQYDSKEIKEKALENIKKDERIELEDTLTKLIIYFYDLPYIDSLKDTIEELIPIFYYCQNILELADEEILEHMKNAFHKCGSVEMLGDYFND